LQVSILCERVLSRSVIATSAQLRCAEGLSLRLVQEQLAERYGIRRSMGAIVGDLRRWRCAHCGAGQHPPDA